MRKLIGVNNVPTPYRLHLFDALWDEARRWGIEFEGVFMASKLAMRRFHENVSTSLASYRVASGHQWLLRDTTIHFNLKLVAQLIFAPPDYLALAAPRPKATVFDKALLWTLIHGTRALQ